MPSSESKPDPFSADQMGKDAAQTLCRRSGRDRKSDHLRILPFYESEFRLHPGILAVWIATGNIPECKGLSCVSSGPLKDEEDNISDRRPGGGMIHFIETGRRTLIAALPRRRIRIA